MKMVFKKIFSFVSYITGFTLFVIAACAIIISLIHHLVVEKSFYASIDLTWNNVRIWREFALSWFFITLGNSMSKKSKKKNTDL